MERVENLTFSIGTSEEIDSVVEDMLEYHTWNVDQVALGKKVRTALADAVRAIIGSVPPSADRSAAIRKIREARMDCNSAITHNGKY